MFVKPVCQAMTRASRLDGTSIYKGGYCDRSVAGLFVNRGKMLQQSRELHWPPHEVIATWGASHTERSTMAKRTTNKKSTNGRRMVRQAWTKENLKELKGHSRAKTPVTKISKAMKRTIGALRQKAFSLGLSLGHRR
jgi:hypothetical protein